MTGGVGQQIVSWFDEEVQVVFHGKMHQVADWPLESHHASVQSHE